MAEAEKETMRPGPGWEQQIWRSVFVDINNCMPPCDPLGPFSIT